MQRRSTQRGFTLLEVLVATSIMAIAITGLMSALSTSIRNAARLGAHDRVTLLARQKMDELLAAKLPPNTVLEGKWDAVQAAGAESGWRARTIISDSLPNPTAGTWVVNRIELVVWWNFGGEQKISSLEAWKRYFVTPRDVAAGALRPPQ